MNQEEINKLPFRQGVQAFIINNDKQVLIVSAVDDHEYWKMPAGGIDPGETSEQAVHREMKEELNIDIEIIKKSKHRNEFLWPEHAVKKHGYKYKGQQQNIFIVKIKPNQNIVIKEDEVYEYKWINSNEIGKYFKFQNQIESTNKVFDEFKELF